MFRESLKTGVRMFGGIHLVTLCIFLIAIISVILLRKQFMARPLLDKIFKYSLCAFAGIMEIICCMWIFFYLKGTLLEILPFELCTITLWLTIIGMVFKNEKILKITFFLSTTGALIALLITQVKYAPPHFRFFHYFLVHFAFLLVNCYMVATGQVKIRFKDSFLAGLFLVGIGMPMYGLNKILGTNYMYTIHLPAQLSSLEKAIGMWYLPLFGLFMLAMFQFSYWIKTCCFFIAYKLNSRNSRTHVQYA